MQIYIADAPFQTLIFGTLFCVALLFSFRWAPREKFFDPSRTEELKGLAILAILFSHIGYFLSTDQRFLWPFSILAGVGVNLFLFLSGLGLTLSEIKKSNSITYFYLKRLRKLFVPFWLVITAFFLMDFFILGKSYSVEVIRNSYLGFFPVADLFLSLNSPLWYFTIILFYYLIFPLFFIKKLKYLSPVLMMLGSFFLLKQDFLLEYINEDVLKLYKLHFISFPLGVLFALIVSERGMVAFKLGFKKIFLENDLKDLLIIIFLGIFAYTSVHSGVGLTKEIEQTTSLITMFSIIFIFLAKNFEFKMLNLFGLLSYEIYLIHWPVLSRYDFLYKNLPGSVATVLYLLMFLGIGYLLSKITRKIS